MEVNASVTHNIIQRFKSVPYWAYLVFISGFLRLVNIGQESLWYDESFTAWLSKLDWSSLWGAIRGDVHPPLWYVIEWINVRLFGTSEVALRVPAALLSVIAVLLVRSLALKVGFKRGTAFLAGLMAAALPNAIYYGQDARMYPLLSCFVLLATLAAMRENWILFAVGATGAVYTQNLGLFYVLSIGIAIMLTRSRTWRSLIKPVLAGSATLLAWLPWSQVMLQQAKAMGAGFWLQDLTAGGALWPIPSMTMGLRMAAPVQLHVFGTAIGISLIGLISCRRWIFTRSGMIVMSVIFGTPLLVALVSLLWRSVYLPRALLPSALGLCLLWAYPLRHLSRPNRRLAQAVVVPMLLISLVSHYFPATNARFTLRSWADTVQDGWRSGDVVYHIAIDSCILFGYYLPGKPYVLLPHVGDLNQSLTEETKSYMGFNSEPFDRLRMLGYRRAWLIATTNPMTSATQLQMIERIKRTYSWQIVRQHSTEVSDQIIYLIDLVNVEL